MVVWKHSLPSSPPPPDLKEIYQQIIITIFLSLQVMSSTTAMQKSLPGEDVSGLCLYSVKCVSIACWYGFILLLVCVSVCVCVCLCVDTCSSSCTALWAEATALCSVRLRSRGSGGFSRESPSSSLPVTPPVSPVCSHYTCQLTESVSMSRAGQNNTHQPYKDFQPLMWHQPQDLNQVICYSCSCEEQSLNLPCWSDA